MTSTAGSGFGPGEPGSTPADSIALTMRSWFADGTLAFIDDPQGCDLWRRPRETFADGGGDCDDHSITVASMCQKLRIPWVIVAGVLYVRGRWEGHAWVEGTDVAGWFLIEATNGTIYRGARPTIYRRRQLLSLTSCAPAPEFVEEQVAAHQINHVPAIPWGPPLPAGQVPWLSSPPAPIYSARTRYPAYGRR